jgi:hypothetical protein
MPKDFARKQGGARVGRGMAGAPKPGKAHRRSKSEPDVVDVYSIDPFLMFGVLPQESEPGSVVVVSSVDLEKRVITLSSNPTK